MIAGIKSELKKIFTVRSTYILIALALAYMLLYNFWVVGFRAGHTAVAPIDLRNPFYLVIQVTRAKSIIPPILFSTIIAILLMAHEYRYNTIMYTLTFSNSRSKTLLAKILAVTGFSIIFSTFVIALAPLLTVAGLDVHHLKIVHQVFYYRDFIWRVYFFGWAYGMIGLLLVLFIRNIVASIVAIFLIPATIEPLIGLLLNANQQQYMPFTALTAVLNNHNGNGQLSAVSSTLVAVVYLLVVGSIAWFLFLRRDAN